MSREKPRLPRLHGVGVVVVRDDGAVLMNHRDDKNNIAYPDHWTYPAGGTEEGESYRDGALRELIEEAGYTPTDIFPLVEKTYERHDGKIVHRHIFWTRYDGVQEIQCNEGQEMRFLHIEELADKKTIPGQIEIMQKAIQAAQSVNEKPVGY